MIKTIETLGTLAGIAGAFLVALKFATIGYPLFALSSVLLLVSALQQKQKNFIALQSVFMVANIIGLLNYQ